MSGQAVLVTGAARGIGRAIALRLADDGADVAVADVREAALAEVAAEIEGRGRRTLALATDVRDRDSVEAMVEAVIGAYGRIDVFFNNAGIIRITEFLEHSEADWDEVMGVNAKGVFLCTQAVGRRMVAQGHGKIVNTASVASRIGLPDMVAYAASKAAVMSITRTAALALGPKGVTCNAIAPGIVDTDMWSLIDERRAAIRGLEPGQATSERVGAIPIGRAATPTDVAAVASFLASPDADYMNGQTVNVDGGTHPS